MSDSKHILVQLYASALSYYGFQDLKSKYTLTKQMDQRVWSFFLVKSWILVKTRSWTPPTLPTIQAMNEEGLLFTWGMLMSRIPPAAPGNQPVYWWFWWNPLTAAERARSVTCVHTQLRGAEEEHSVQKAASALCELEPGVQINWFKLTTWPEQTLQVNTNLTQVKHKCLLW